LLLAIGLITHALGDNSKNPLGPWYLSDKERGWYFDALLGVEYEPTYAGSDKYEFEPEFNLRAFFRDSGNNRYFASLGEIGGIFEITPDLMLSAVLEYEEGRDAEEDSTLEGFDEVDDTVEGQFSLFYRFKPDTYLAVVFQPDLLGRGKGLVYFVAVGNDTMLLSDRLRLSTVVDLSFANSEHMRTEFGVTDSEAVATGLRAYRPDGGLKSVTGSVGIEFFLGEHWSFLFDSEVEFYLADAAPIARSLKMREVK
jgi:outer membrane scaffolding protein for murein synthesis (MipA/OmpV family)